MSKDTLLAGAGPALELEGAGCGLKGVTSFCGGSCLGALRACSGAGGEAGRLPPPLTESAPALSIGTIHSGIGRCSCT
eukprot:10403261-Alexandrium_andersonii.AAC.1